MAYVYEPGIWAIKQMCGDDFEVAPAKYESGWRALRTLFNFYVITNRHRQILEKTLSTYADLIDQHWFYMCKYKLNISAIKSRTTYICSSKHGPRKIMIYRLVAYCSLELEGIFQI